jgi:hypothetical protein
LSPLPPAGGDVERLSREGAERVPRDDSRETATDGGRATDRLTGLVLLACVLFNPPVLRAFGAGDRLFGWPLIYLYIFLVWGGVIVLAARLLDRNGGG